MAQVKLTVKEEQVENHVSVGLKQEPDIGGVLSLENTSSVLNIKVEPEEVGIKPETVQTNCPNVHVVVKCEDEEQGSDREGGIEEKPLKAEEHGENSPDTDDSEDWISSFERPTPQAHSEGNKVEDESAEGCCSSDSEQSWEFNPPIKTPARTKRQMEDYPDGAPQNKVHKCSDCGKVFPHSARLRKHQLRHTLKCPVCAKKCTDMCILKAHLRTHTGEKPFKCTVCTRAFALKGNLNQHIKRHTDKTLFKCSVCGSEFTTSNKLNLHMTSHTGQKPFKCSICTKDFTVPGALKQHMMTHTGEKPFKCSFCAKEVRSLGDLKRHIRTHTGEKPFRCSVCQRDFRVQSDLKRHLRTHSFSCPTCGKDMGTEKRLKLHMRTHTEERPFVCTFCSKSYSQSSNLKIHMRTHTGERPFRCSVCACDFPQKSSLKRHMSIHPDIAGVQSKTDPDSLKKEPDELNIKAEPLIHLSVKSDDEQPKSSFLCETVKEETRADTEGEETGKHGENSSDTDDSEDWSRSAERPTPQSHCDCNQAEAESAEGCCSSDSEQSWEFNPPTKTSPRTKRQMEDYLAFTQGSDLKESVTWSHEGDGSYKCPVCAKGFVQVGALKPHMRTHTGERPFTCPLCAMDFTQLSNLKRHMRSHTGQRPFTCTACGKDFTCKRNLKRHIIIHSREKLKV